MKLDPWKNKQKFDNWKKAGSQLNGISKYNSKLIVEYIDDMEGGYNCKRPGSRSYSRLNNLKQRMRWMALEMEKVYKKDKITDLTKREISDFFNILMRKGKIQTRTGKNYTSVRDYANVFKAFWNWYIRREEENGNEVHDRTTFIDMSKVKESEFVYFTIEEFRRIASHAKFDYKVLMWFLFDSGIRAPTELMNIKVCDLSPLKNSENFEVNIRDEVSKTFGRKIKLLLCSSILKEYLQDKQLKGDDFLFPIYPKGASQYIKRLAVRVLGDYRTKGGALVKDIRMYDFRHSAACYWLPRYKSESALKYRFGWKENEMIHHYTKLLGMKDTIEEKDILLDGEARTQMEKELERETRAREMLQEKYDSLEKSMGERFKQMEEMFRKQIMEKALTELETD
ncbi:MAG: hypothetical protein ABIH82_05765 [Candidatus Woesearchaeota archaeon]